MVQKCWWVRCYVNQWKKWNRIVDLKYPNELHELHNDYPLAPEKLAITNDMLSKYCKKIPDKCDIKVGDVKKLIPSLGNKTKHVLHYRNLQLYLPLEIKDS